MSEENKPALMVANEDILVSESLQQIALALQEMINDAAGKPMGFCLQVFNAQPGSRMNYVSNCKREEVAATMKELLVAWEEGMPDVPAHDFKG